MSYILEALKKSERERARGNIPTLETAPAASASRRGLWLGVLIGAGTLASLGLGAWIISLHVLGPGQAATPATVSDPAGEREPPTAGEEVAGEGAAREASAGQTEPRVAASSTDDAARPDPETGSANQPEARPAEAASSTRVRGAGELSPRARARVRDLSVNVVSYSEVPERRFVMLNQRIYRESDTVGDGVVLKEILPQGALLDVDGYEIVIGPE